MIQLTNISKSFAMQELFSNLNFRLNSRNRVGLVGRNGSGKSTLFKLILDEEHPFFKEIYSLILSAHIASQPLHLNLNGCVQGISRIKHVSSFK